MFSFCVARSAPDLKEVSGARDACVCEQSAVVYPQRAKIQLFVGIGKRCPAHVGSSESEKEDVSKLGCSMRRSFCIDKLLYYKVSELNRRERLFPNKKQNVKTENQITCISSFILDASNALSLYSRAVYEPGGALA
jgi:hypothetical protein